MTANTYSGGTVANVGASGAYVTVDGADVGLLKNPAAVYEATMEFIARQFGQDSQARASAVKGEAFTLDLVLAEYSNTNLVYYLGGLGEVSGATVSFGGNRGETMPTYEVKVYFLHPDGHPQSGRVLTVYQAELHPNGSITHDTASDDFEGLPIQIVATLDTARTAGDQLCSWAAADTTAPTVSESSPADGATGVTATTDPTVTFSLAIGEGTVTEDTVILMKSDGSAFVDITSLTLNAAKTILTIASPTLTSATAYDLILSGVRGTNGVALARTCINFTTT